MTDPILSLSGKQVACCRRFYGFFSPDPALSPVFYSNNFPQRLGYFKAPSLFDFYHGYTQIGAPHPLEKYGINIQKQPQTGDGAWLTLQGIVDFTQGRSSGLAWNEIRDLWTEVYKATYNPPNPAAKSGEEPPLKAEGEYVAAPLVYDSIVAALTAVKLNVTQAPWQSRKSWMDILESIRKIPPSTFTPTTLNRSSTFRDNWPGMAMGWSDYRSAPKGLSVTLTDETRYKEFRDFSVLDSEKRIEFMRAAADAWLGTLATNFTLQGVNFTTWTNAQKYFDGETFDALRYFWNLAVLSGWEPSGNLPFSTALKAVARWAESQGLPLNVDNGTLAFDLMKKYGGFIYDAVRIVKAARGDTTAREELSPNVTETDVQNAVDQVVEVTNAAAAEAEAQAEFLRIFTGDVGFGISRFADNDRTEDSVSWRDLARAGAFTWPTDMVALSLDPAAREKFTNRLLEIWGSLYDKIATSPDWKKTAQGWVYTALDILVPETDEEAKEDEKPSMKIWLLIGLGVALLFVFFRGGKA